MSLLMWLPLNGNLKNKGVDPSYDVPSTNYSTWVADGKIGEQSLNCTTITSGVLSYNKTLTNDHSYSICAWIKTSSTVTTTTRYIIWTGSDSNDVGFGFRMAYGSTTIVQAIMFGTIINMTIESGKWHHVAMTIDYENLKFSAYLDGVLIDTKSYSIKTVANYGVNIGWLRPSYYPFLGCINDVRIYDHCLSSVEVKEISRGLILHYKLDGFLPNGVILHEYLEKSSTWGIDDYIDTGVKDYTVNSIRCLCKASVNDTYDSAFFGSRGQYYLFYNLNSNYFWPQSKAETVYDTLEVDTKYIIDYNRGHFTVSDEYGILYQEAFRSGETIQTNNLYIFNFNPLDASHRTSQAKIYYFKIYNNGALIRNFLPCSYLGEPGFWDTVENKFYGNQGSGTFTLGPELQQDVIKDSSGYGNNGTVTGSLYTSLDTPRYNESRSFNSSKIVSSDLNLSGTEPITLSCWFKITASQSYQPVVWIGNGTTANGICVHGSKCNRLQGGNGITTFNDTGTSVYENVWNHMVITWDKSSVKRYINGVLSQTVDYTTGFGDTLLRLYVGYFWGGYYAGKISDVRVYATALSTEDIRQLYEVSAKIDNSGKLHSYEIDEYLDEGRELMVRNITKGYTSNTTSHLLTVHDGIFLNPANTSVGTNFIEIDPTGKKYIYDFTISVATGNQFHIGFERYDANKTSRSNNACVYALSIKPTSDIVEKRYKGVIDLSTDGVNPCKYIKLRVLNGWTGSASDSDKITTIHKLSLREISTSSSAKTKLLKTNIFKTDLLLEGNTKVEIEKNIDTNVNEFIET